MVHIHQAFLFHWLFASLHNRKACSNLYELTIGKAAYWAQCSLSFPLAPSVQSKQRSRWDECEPAAVLCKINQHFILKHIQINADRRPQFSCLKANNYDPYFNYPFNKNCYLEHIWMYFSMPYGLYAICLNRNTYSTNNMLVFFKSLTFYSNL